MKKGLLGCFCILALGTTKAQIITDTVSLGAGYSNQIWYSLENDNQGEAPKTNWDIAFSLTNFGTSIRTNGAIGTMLWTYPNSDISGWENVDTTGMSAWTPQYNSDTSWALGAFDRNITSDPFDVGWGTYNVITHIITGDSLFIIKLSNGDYKKIVIENVLDGAYNFKYANIDGSDSQTTSLLKSNFTGKLLAYYSLQNNVELNREPAAVDWDLLFTQYTAFIPTPYLVAGVLSNNGVLVAQADEIADVATYTDYQQHTFNHEINSIGSDWKNFTGSAWTLADSTIYFVRSKPGAIWKLVFTGFSGSSTGSFIFTKEKISAVGIPAVDGVSAASLAVYPNPSNGQSVTILFNVEKPASKISLSVFDLSGRSVYASSLNGNTGLQSHILSTSGLKAGIYFVSMEVNGARLQQKLVVQN